MEPVFDFHPGGELEDDVVDSEELQLEAEGNLNPAVTTLADVVNVEDDTVVKVSQARGKPRKESVHQNLLKGKAPFPCQKIDFDLLPGITLKK
ncbi:hypothetical protein RHMOL_Rhmol10G0184600 [Rhododendron molle]|uniref:Uncharacterized protein n=1 Tax=Rhododendron molle TaxID=49168 RepID=A0ACC0M4R1_RHOML|nr:hypothetical protein RHMOL_Rhmol10G0184600 [Rhododendron molle]